jgi:hypothetical protein
MPARIAFPLLALSAILAGSVPPAVHPWICDDAFITLRYVRNAGEGLGLVYNHGERVEGYTHFLWAVLLWCFSRLGIDPVAVASWLPVPFYFGTLLLLVLSGRALQPPLAGPPSRGFPAEIRSAQRVRFPLRAPFPRGPGLPLAAVLWAVHREALVFASGGLETSAYTFFLVLGFHLLAFGGSERARASGIAACAGAALLRPEGCLHLGLALGYATLALRERRRDRAGVAPLRGESASAHDAAAKNGFAVGGEPRASARPARAREVARLVGLALALLVPLFVWRALYYHDVLPNAFYAKSASRPYWSQGWFYVGFYFRFYMALGIGAVAGALLLPWARFEAPTRRVRAPLALAAAQAGAIVLGTAYVGGDFMFARFLLPATPFLALLAQHAVHCAPRGRMAIAVLLAGATLAGGIWRERTFRWPKMERGIVDERSAYPPEVVAEGKKHGRLLAQCFQSTSAGFLILGAQASYAYWGRLPVAVEAHGLADRFIAHLPLAERGRPGHERRPPLEYLLRRQVRFLIHLPGSPPRREYARIRFGELEGEIFTYDRALMDRVRECQGVEFVDFPAYLDGYLEGAERLPPAVLARDLEAFKTYYFDHNEDPHREARLLQQLRRGERHRGRRRSRGCRRCLGPRDGRPRSAGRRASKRRGCRCARRGTSSWRHPGLPAPSRPTGAAPAVLARAHYPLPGVRPASSRRAPPPRGGGAW